MASHVFLVIFNQYNIRYVDIYLIENFLGSTYLYLTQNTLPIPVYDTRKMRRNTSSQLETSKVPTISLGNH